MGFPKAAEMVPAQGVAGDFASGNPKVFAWDNYLAGENGVTIGNFVWLDSSKGTVSNTGSGAPLGIAHRDLRFPNYEVQEDGTLLAPAGSSIAVIRKGDVFVTAGAAATVGQKVFALEASGVANFGTAGGAVSSATETEWTVMTAGSQNDLVVVSNY